MKIKRIEPIAISLPLIKPVKMSFEEVRNANNALVRLETDGGVIGWGEAASAPTMNPETSCTKSSGMPWRSQRWMKYALDMLDELEATAFRGRLDDAQRACLEHYVDGEDFQARSKQFERLAAFTPVEVNASYGESEPERVAALRRRAMS